MDHLVLARLGSQGTWQVYIPLGAADMTLAQAKARGEQLFADGHDNMVVQVVQRNERGYDPR